MGWETSNVAATVTDGVPQFNPLQVIGNIATIRNQLNENKLFQARQAAGAALQQSIDPTTHQVDQLKYNQLISQNPLIAAAAMDAVQGGQTVQKSGIGIQASQMDLNRAQLLAAYRDMAIGGDAAVRKGIKAGNYPAQIGAIATGGGQGTANPVWTPPQPSSPVPDASAPAPASDNAEPPISASRMAYLSGDPAAIQGVVGSPTAVGAGNRTEIVMPSPLAGTTANVGSVTMGTPPQIAQSDNGQLINYNAIPGQSPGASGTVLSVQRQLPVGSQVFAPTPGEPAGGHFGLTSPNGIVQSQPLIGAAPAAEAVATSSAQQLAQARAQAATVNTRVLTLKKALSGLQGANTGPGTDFTNNVSSFLQSQVPFGLGKILPGVNPNAIKNRDEADKYLTQYAMAQSSQFGPTTDSRLATALTGNASTHISNLAARDVVKTNIGIERMGAAAQAAFDASGQPPENASKYFAQWGRTVDPAAFVADLQTKAQRQAYMKTLKPADKAQYLQGLRQALQTGMISETDLAK